MGIFNSKQSKKVRSTITTYVTHFVVKKKEIYYEKLLTTLQEDIKKRQKSIQRLKTFNRSCQVHLVLFSSIFYGGYSVFLFLQHKLKLSNTQNALNKSSLAFLLLFPVGVFFLKKLLARGFNFLVSRKQQRLRVKQAELKDRIEELKVETRYYQTKDLIEKYDKEVETEVKPELTRRPNKAINSDVSTVGSVSTVSTVGSVSSNNTNTRSNTSSTSRANNSNNNSNINRPLPLHPYPSHHPTPIQRPFTPPFRSPTWMDRFMDALIGDDSRNQKYALICAQCFNHNGLATPELFETVRYRCPNCGFFNQPIKKRDERDERIQEIKNEVKCEEESEKKSIMSVKTKNQ